MVPAPVRMLGVEIFGMTAGLLGPAVGVGASVVGLVIAQVTGTGGGGSEWVEFGAIGVLGRLDVGLPGWLYFGYAALLAGAASLGRQRGCRDPRYGQWR